MASVRVEQIADENRLVGFVREFGKAIECGLPFGIGFGGANDVTGRLHNRHSSRLAVTKRKRYINK